MLFVDYNRHEIKFILSYLIVNATPGYAMLIIVSLISVQRDACTGPWS